MSGGLHVGLIMDGNGRWASARGLRRTEGHRRGADAVRRAVEAAPGLGVTTLTLYAFSADNWRRPAAEVSALMGLLESFLVRERADCRRQGVRLALIGRRDRLSSALIRAIEETERATRAGARLYLRLAVDYSARSAILAAAGALRPGEPCDESGFLRRVNRACHSDPDTPPVDLVVRTSGEQRLSDFLLFEAAYAELLFTDTLWPDFDGEDLRRAVEAFRRRERRYGGLARDEGDRGRADVRGSSRIRTGERATDNAVVGTSERRVGRAADRRQAPGRGTCRSLQIFLARSWLISL